MKLNKTFLTALAAGLCLADYVDSTYHRSYCSCGESRLNPHTISNQHYVHGHLMGNCLDCGALIDLSTSGGRVGVASVDPSESSLAAQYENEQVY